MKNKRGKAIILGVALVVAFLMAIPTAVSAVSSGSPVSTSSLTQSVSQEEKDLKLWYQQPAEYSHQGWMTQALPIGNGYMGGMVYGGVDQEVIQFNEKTLWSGGPGTPNYNFGITEDAYKNLDGIRQEMLEQKQESVSLQIQQSVLEQVIDNSTFDLSRNAISQRYNAEIDNYQEQAKLYGMRLSQMASSYGMDEGSFKEYVYASVEENAKSQLVLDTIAAQEGIAVTDEARQELADMNGQTVEEGVEAYGQESFDQMALNRQVMKFLEENAVNEAEAASGSEADEAGTATASQAKETTAAETEAKETTAAEAEE